MNIKDCRAVVTGGASGLGEACVRHISNGGGRAAILDLMEEKGETLAAELGNHVIFIRTDITDSASVQAAIDKTVDAFGGINVVLNCAGIALVGLILGKDGPISLDHFNKVIQVNLLGSLNVIRLALAHMVNNDFLNKDGERGVIINTASIAAFEGQIGASAYAASKGGIVSMTLAMAREFSRHGIRIMTIAPGVFNTPMTESLTEKTKSALETFAQFPRRHGKPSEYAQLVQHIIENTMLNGEVIRIDGAVRLQP